MESYKEVFNSNYPNYIDYVKNWDYELIDHERLGSYQGQIYCLLKRWDDKYALFNVSYGSCSVCDFLEANRNDLEKITKFFERKRKQLQFKELDKILKQLKDDDDLGFWEHKNETVVNMVEKEINNTD